MVNYLSIQVIYQIYIGLKHLTESVSLLQLHTDCCSSLLLA